MRKKAIYIFIPLVLLLGLGYYFFFNLILETGLEKSLELIVGAKVEVDQLRFRITTPSISIQRFQIANPQNPWRNLIETGDMQFKLAREPLFSGKFVIEQIRLAEFRWDTPRKTSGKLPQPPKQGSNRKSQSKLGKAIASIPVFNSDLLQGELNQAKDKMLAEYQFQIHVDATAIQNQLANSAKEWEQQLKNFEQAKLKLQDIERQLAELKVNQLKTLPDINKALTSITKLNQSLTEVRNETGAIQGGIQSELDAVNLEIKNLTTTAGQDYQALLKLAKLPDFQNIRWTEILVGQSLMEKTDFVLDLVDKVQAFLPPLPNIPPPKKPIRGGQDIIFPGRRTYPNFLIENIFISARESQAASTGGYYAQGSVSGITSDPPIYGQPLRIDLSGTAPGNLAISLRGVMDHVTPQIDDVFSLSLDHLSLPKLNIGASSYLPESISVGDTAIRSELRIKSNEFRLDLFIDGRNLDWNYEANQVAAGSGASGDFIRDIIQQTLSRMDQLTVHFQMIGQDQQLKVSISSELDKLFNERLNQVLGEKYAKFTQELQAEVNRRLQEEQGKLEQTVHQYQQELTAKYQELQTLVDREAKALEAQRIALEEKLKQDFTQKLNPDAEKAKQELEAKLKQLKGQLP